MKIYNLAVISILTLTLITACTQKKSDVLTSNNDLTIVNTSDNNLKDVNIYSKLFEFDENKIIRALEEGKQKDISEYLKSKYKLTPDKYDYNDKAEVILGTPYSQTMQESALIWRQCNYNEEFFKSGMNIFISNVKDNIKLNGQFLNFTVTFFYNNEAEVNSIQYNVEQNNEIMKSSKNVWIFEAKEIKEPSLFKYSRKTLLFYNFKIDKPIDLYKKVYLRLIYEPSKECIYEIDLNKYN